ncbi:VTT domain-containing protein [Methylobacterium sp. Leaf466]|uniref:TVP38/TMEM64 family protein n=1 Tax=Methylobacterium sp. Leaf466 TaxID=1736386 RepID=UPI0006F56AF9|nr:VTT domain-containing protein [Methylobacterium sp. Leaf466]KQT84324.1 SNARE associated Golgi family protein [Methylobacterium sp. Leaf466]
MRSGGDLRWRGGAALRWLPFALLVAASVGVLVSGASRFVDLDQLLASRAWLSAAVAENPARAMATAWLVYVGCVVVSVPASLFLTMICGFLFGMTAGACLAVAAASTGAAIVFSIGRWAAADLLARRAGPRLAALADGFRRDAFGYVVVLRLLPVFPFWLTNLAPAAFGVRLSTFVLATVVGLTPGAFVYAAAGAAIEDIVATHEAARAACLAASGLDCDATLSFGAFATPKTVAGLVALAALALGSVALKRWFDRRQRRRGA